jgi:hypothetical protein
VELEVEQFDEIRILHQGRTVSQIAREHEDPVRRDQADQGDAIRHGPVRAVDPLDGEAGEVRPGRSVELDEGLSRVTPDGVVEDLRDERQRGGRRRRQQDGSHGARESQDSQLRPGPTERCLHFALLVPGWLAREQSKHHAGTTNGSASRKYAELGTCALPGNTGARRP